MSRRTFFKLIQWSGILIFGATVFITLLFAEGYQYDPVTRNIVKKGIVYFEGGLSKDTAVFVNEKRQNLVRSGELWLTPGTYSLELRHPGALPWKRQITVPNDTVLHFPPLRFIDEKKSFMNILMGISGLQYTPFSHEGVFFYDKGLHYAKYFAFENELLSKRLTFSIEDVTIRSPFEELMALPTDVWIYRQHDGTVAFFDREKKKETTIQGEKMLALRAIGRRVFGLDQEGTVWELFDEGEARLFFNVPVSVSSLRDVAHEDSFFLFQFSKPDGGGLLVVTDSDGAIAFQEKEVSASALQQEVVSYVKGGKLMAYHLGTRTTEVKKNITTPLIWFSPIGETFQSLFLTEAHELFYCDEDFENCTSLGLLDTPFIEGSTDRQMFLAIMQKQLVFLNFEEEQSIPKLLQNLISWVFVNG